MADFLSVDIAVLSNMVTLLRGSEQVLNDAMNAMKQGGHGDIGPEVLNTAADGFQSRWRYGLERIGEHASDTANGVSQCRDAYEAADQEFGNTLRQAQDAMAQSMNRYGGAVSERSQ